MNELRTITLNPDEVRRAAERPGQPVELWIRYNDNERALRMPYAHLMRLYDVVRNCEGLTDIVVTFDLLKYAYVTQYGFRLAGK